MRFVIPIMMAACCFAQEPPGVVVEEAVAPVYPAAAVTGRISGSVIVTVHVSDRGAVTNAIADASPALVSVLSLAQRAQLLEVVKQSEASTPSDFKAARARIEKALKNPACSELCAF